MFKVHTGRLANPGELAFVTDGYWFKDVDDEDYHFVRYHEPKQTRWPLRRMYGVSVAGVFLGVMRFAKPETE